MKVNLPAKVEVTDYHEFSNLQEKMKHIIPGIKIKEIGCIGNYIGIAYVGNIQEKKNQKLFQELKKKVELASKCAFGEF